MQLVAGLILLRARICRTAPLRAVALVRLKEPYYSGSDGPAAANLVCDDSQRSHCGCRKPVQPGVHWQKAGFALDSRTSCFGRADHSTPLYVVQAAIK